MNSCCGRFYDPDIIGITETRYCIDRFQSPYVKTELILNMVEVVESFYYLNVRFFRILAKTLLMLSG